MSYIDKFNKAIDNEWVYWYVYYKSLEIDDDWKKYVKNFMQSHLIKILQYRTDKVKITFKMTEDYINELILWFKRLDNAFIEHNSFISFELPFESIDTVFIKERYDIWYKLRNEFIQYMEERKLTEENKSTKFFDEGLVFTIIQDTGLIIFPLTFIVLLTISIYLLRK